MSEHGERMVDRSKEPACKAWPPGLVRKTINAGARLSSLLRQTIPECFSPNGCSVAKNTGGELRFKKSKSFCTLIRD